MSDIIDEIVDLLHAHERACRRPSRIEIGDKQAHLLAQALGNKPLYHRPTNEEIMADLRGERPLPEGPPWTAEEILASRNVYLFGVRLVGVESPDYLNVEGT